MILSFFSLSSQASSLDEINHLLNYVGSTECNYERNGKMHKGLAAKKHIKKKYDYFYDDIKTAEDFILYSATKSKISGKYYKIHCAGSPSINSNDWLQAELTRYRLSKN